MEKEHFDNGYYAIDPDGQEFWFQFQPRLVKKGDVKFWDASHGYINDLPKGTIKRLTGKELAPFSLVDYFKDFDKSERIYIHEPLIIQKNQLENKLDKKTINDLKKDIIFQYCHTENLVEFEHNLFQTLESLEYPQISRKSSKEKLEDLDSQIEALQRQRELQVQIIEKEELNKLSLKVGDLYYDTNNELNVIASINYEKPAFPNKSKKEELVVGALNLNSPTMLFFTARDHKMYIKKSNNEYSRIKDRIEVIGNIDIKLINKYIENKVQLTRIISSRLKFDADNGEGFKLENTNKYAKAGKEVIPKVAGLDIRKDRVVSAIFQINDFETFALDYREAFYREWEELVDRLKQADKNEGTNSLDLYMQISDAKLIKDIEKLSEIDILDKELNREISNILEHNEIGIDR